MLPTYCHKTVTPHVLRRTTGMNLLHAGVDTSVIALWFGHESTEATQIYLHGDMAIKERALARVTPLGVKPGRYRRPTRSSPSSRISDHAEQRWRSHGALWPGTSGSA